MTTSGPYEHAETTRQRDLDVIAVAIQNTVAESNRRDGLESLRRIEAALAELDQAREALSESLDVIVERWHQSDSDLSLSDWMELSWEEYAIFAERGYRGYIQVIAARAALVGSAASKDET
jgi:hypothetical protein